MSELTIRTHDEMGGFELILSPKGWKLFDNAWDDNNPYEGPYPIPEKIYWLLNPSDEQLEQIKNYEREHLGIIFNCTVEELKQITIIACIIGDSKRWDPYALQKAYQIVKNRKVVQRV